MVDSSILIEKNTLAEKQCSVCGQVLPIFEFRRYKKQAGAFEYRYSCRECEKEQNRKRRQQEKVQLGINNTPVEKQCGVCKQVLPIVKFRRYENRSGTFGYRGSCRECEKAQGRESYRREKVQSNVNNIEKEDNYRFLDFYKKIKGG